MDDLVLFTTPEELIAAANSSAENVAAEYKQTIFLYTITRYLVPIFEVREGKLPLTVWNEYRNALDHQMRHILGTGTGISVTNSNIEKMESHIQRAALDVCKLICHVFPELIESKIQSDRPECLRLVKDGNFYKSIREGMALAEAEFMRAKTADTRLGSNHMTNNEIVGVYLEPTFRYVRLLGEYESEYGAIENAIANATTLKNKGKILGLTHEVFGHFVYSILAAGFTWAGISYKEYIWDLLGL